METAHPPGTPAPCGPGGPPGHEPRFRMGSPADVLAVVPYLLGFHPERSFVVIGAAGPRQRVDVGFRYDLPDPPGAADAADIAAHAAATLRRQRISTVIGVGYGPGPLVTPVADEFAAVIRRHRLRLRELLRVEDGRYWSYLCHNVNCCPERGVPFDCRSHPAAAALTLAGVTTYPDRLALAATVAPLAGDAAAAATAALRRAQARALALGPGDPSAPAGLSPVVIRGRRAVRAALRAYRAGGRLASEDSLAWLLVTLAHLPVRDDAWARMLPEHRHAHLSLWRDLVRRAPGPLLPAPACLLAFTAWQAGDGALANVALDRALAADPCYTMALLLRDVLATGVPPSAARPPMTPRQVARGYSGRVREGRPESPSPGCH